MKIGVLQRALQNYVLLTDLTDNERQEAFRALDTCSATLERYDDRDLWHNEVTLLTDWSLDNILNCMTYDIYGKLAKKFSPEVDFMHYANKCREHDAFEHFTDEQLQTGYDIISSLWLDNEQEDSHNEDGTFKR